MSFTNWLRNLRLALEAGRAQRKHRRRESLRATTFQPRLEALEDRWLPSFLPAVSYPVGLDPSAVVTGDFNGDGRIDLAIANAGSDTLSVLLGNGDGSFQAARTSPLGAAGGLAVADFNGDGKADLVAWDSSSVQVLLGNGDGAFQAGQTAPTFSSMVGAVAVGDLNGDGKADLVVTGYDVVNAGDQWDGVGVVQVLLGNGDGAFARYWTTWDVGIDLGSVALADLNGDGNLDVVTGDSYYYNSGDPGAVYVLLGNGDGTLQPATSFATASAPSAVAVADFNGDGIPDLVTANDIGGPYSVSILAGNGDGSFQSARDFGTAGARGLAVADLNGDGRADVAMAGGGWGYSTATVLLGNGDGTLQPPIQYGNGPGGHVAVADFNGDGWSDLAVSCYNNDVSVLLNAADWAATSPGSFAVSGFPSSTTAGAAGSFTVTAKNADGAADAGYTGTVHFTSSDPQAVLPADYTFTAADKGVHTFSATLKTAGTQSITATDITTASLVGMDAGITVNAAAASQFIISGPSSVKVGVPFSLTVTVEDAYGNVVTGYIGTIHFTSSDNKATLPANYTFTAADKGVHTFTGLILRKKGSQKITITDALDSSLTGSVIENVL